MDIINDLKEMRAFASEARAAGRTIAFVPTMGALHAGHASLFKAAAQHGDIVVASSFLNPLQFNDKQDYERYPRKPEEDYRLARDAGVAVFFEPSAEEMYPHGFLTSVNVSYLGERLEGESRPGHFRGVCTVVLKLFCIVQPHAALFGYKDAQQFAIITHMVRDLAMDIRIVGVPTVREKDGLAMSSRNALLSPEAREQALCLARALRRVHFLVKKQGIVHSGELLQAVRSAINSAGPGVELDYARIVSRTTLEDMSNIERGNTFVLVAARVGGVRLIDSTRL